MATIYDIDELKKEVELLLQVAKRLADLEDEDGGRRFPSKQDCAFARSVIATVTGKPYER